VTWVIGASSLFGYGVVLLDVRVRLADGTRADLVKKAYPVSSDPRRSAPDCNQYGQVAGTAEAAAVLMRFIRRWPPKQQNPEAPFNARGPEFRRLRLAGGIGGMGIRKSRQTERRGVGG
jgi:hypothetical protein